MKDVVVVITFTLTEENIQSDDFQEFLSEIKSGKFRDGMMDEMFQDIKVKYAIYKNKTPRQE